MKLFNLITLVVLCLSVSFIGCSNSDSEKKKAARESLNVPETVTPPVNTTSNTANTNIAGVPHYICPNNCEGSGGPSAGTCQVCGSAYEHNQEFHNQSTPTPTTPAANTTPPTPPAGAAQNAAGVYHYICSNGCAGGAASAGNCASCGNALTHNADFHN